MGITWGGRWDTPDRSHFEVAADWKEKRETEMEKRYETLAGGADMGEGAGAGDDYKGMLCGSEPDAPFR